MRRLTIASIGLLAGLVGFGPTRAVGRERPDPRARGGLIRGSKWTLAARTAKICAPFGASRAPVAQLDRVSASEAEGRGFESRRARQFRQGPFRSRR